MDEFLSGRKDGYFPWESEGVSKTDRDIFFDDENRYFLQLHILLSSFTKHDYVANVSDLTQRANLLRGQILDNWVLQIVIVRIPERWCWFGIPELHMG